jgi:hypothetical protein
MDINENLAEQIVNFGALEYDIQKISIITGFSEIELTNNPDFLKLYEKGRAMSDYVIDLKLFELSKAGDLKALDKLELRKRLRKSN